MSHNSQSTNGTKSTKCKTLFKDAIYVIQGTVLEAIISNNKKASFMIYFVVLVLFVDKKLNYTDSMGLPIK